MAGKEEQSDVKCYDVFNGDADGICALHQLRLAEPSPRAELVTGVKRDISLLDRLKGVDNSKLTVLDISLDSNKQALTLLLQAENHILYIDHHYAGDLPRSERLTHHIHTDADCCTSFIVDTLLEGAYRAWAICGAFGDNLHHVATHAASALGLSETETTSLREIGELLNYNGYGAQVSDLYFPPDHLYYEVHKYPDPFDFFHQSAALKTLRSGFTVDMERALNQPIFTSTGNHIIYRFPDSPWARRVSGVFANLKARENPHGAHALITENKDGSLRISVRAPLTDKRDADTLCRAFPGGGGRAAAAGINALPESLLDSFLEAFTNTYQ